MYAGVIIDITNEALDRAYTYRIPEGMRVHIGDRVSIPFGHLKKPKSGYVIQLSETTELAPEQLKDIIGPEPTAISVKEQLIQLAVWMGEEYGTTLNQCLKTVLPVKRTVGKNSRRVDPLLRYEDARDERRVLNEEQQRAVDGIREALEGNRQQRFLLYGITGSGKTEVYMAVIQEVLERGKQVIVLIPEISLTYQTVLRMSARFRDRVAIMHSRMSAGERYEQYRRCESGQVDIIIGPRSAVFAPFEKLGLIIMDEEHEGAYKSEVSPRYQTRDVAAKRAELAGCPVVYGSATPSLTLYHQAQAGALPMFSLTRRAKEGSALADIEVVDLRQELEKGNRSIFSDRLYQLMQEKLGRGEQIMLFMNRRGYASFVSCRSCGEAVKCPHCDVSLTLHADQRLRCHYCGYETQLMKQCPSCGSAYIAPFGTGTQKLEQLTKKTFPGARVLRMDADTTKNKDGHEKILAAFRSHQADILIGTQMIVKGHDFPDVTLVGMIAADMSLCAPDYKSAERTFQLLTQAAGRAGRDRTQGNVVIQTYQPDHYAVALAATQNYSLFYEKEIIFRRLMGYPPMEYLMTVQASSRDEDFLDTVVRGAAAKLEPSCNAAEAELIGPLQASVYKVNDIFRKIIYIKHKSHDIIIALRNEYAELIRERDKRGLVQLAFDLEG